jgi:hypothetical protein
MEKVCIIYNTKAYTVHRIVNKEAAQIIHSFSITQLLCCLELNCCRMAKSAIHIKK